MYLRKVQGVYALGSLHRRRPGYCQRVRSGRHYRIVLPWEHYRLLQPGGAERVGRLRYHSFINIHALRHHSITLVSLTYRAKAVEGLKPGPWACGATRELTLRWHDARPWRPARAHSLRTSVSASATDAQLSLCLT